MDPIGERNGGDGGLLAFAKPDKEDVDEWVKDNGALDRNKKDLEE